MSADIPNNIQRNSDGARPTKTVSVAEGWAWAATTVGFLGLMLVAGVN
jgi:hypothetical protein